MYRRLEPEKGDTINMPTIKLKTEAVTVYTVYNIHNKAWQRRDTGSVGHKMYTAQKGENAD